MSTALDHTFAALANPTRRGVDGTSLREDARVRVYRLRAEPFATLRDWLDEVELFWAGQLEGFTEHVAKKKSR